MTRHRLAATAAAVCLAFALHAPSLAQTPYQGHGLGSVPQTMLGFFADTVRRDLGISDDLKLLCGISFGYPDPDSPASRFQMDRAAIDESVVFHR